MNDYKQECFKRLEYTQKYSKYSEEDLVEEIIEKDKEIERLNKECDTYMKIATKRGNIIDKLEKYLEEHSKIDFESSDVIFHEQLALRIVYDYLKELKEGK